MIGGEKKKNDAKERSSTIGSDLCYRGVYSDAGYRLGH